MTVDESGSSSRAPFVAAAGTVAAYGLVLAGMTLVLFLIPYLLFVLF